MTTAPTPAPDRVRGRRPLRVVTLAAALAGFALTSSAALAAQPPVGLGTADSYAVIAGSAITNTGPSTINGDVGLSPGTAISGFPPGTINGTVHAADAEAAQATSDLTLAYDDAAGRTPALAVPSELGGLTLTAGVYASASALGLTGTLTLDAQGDPDAVFILKAASSLTTASASRVSLINGAQPCNVFWQVGSSATLGTSSTFAGNILALTSISMNDAVTVRGRALARNGAVTLINDTITVGRCSTPVTPRNATPGDGSGPGGPGAPGTPGGGSLDARNGSSLFTTSPRAVARTIARYGTSRCVARNFRAVVTGLRIRSVVFSLDGRRIARRTAGPFATMVRARAGVRVLTARITFTDATPAVTRRLRYQACAPAQAVVTPPSVSLPPRGPGGFTG
ncbi:ice-binding family protein [Miltoncostaea oceani]|uniref:ice-binding family protein n=1 Tax=Miltoncostaea oceani TaxID=2843216 RepID=UPI001C3E5177|nr:ice-binding family protein [Miltoncostaea oceani]